MDGITVAWVGWLTAGAALEVMALRSARPGDTLSEHVWKWLKVKDGRNPWWTWPFRVALVGGGVWLGLHLGLGI